MNSTNWLFDWVPWDALQGLPALLLFLFALPLLLLAATRKTYPHWPLALAWGAPSLLSLGLLASSDLVLLVGVADVLVVLLGAWDLWSLPGPSQFTAERQTSRIASLGKQHAVTVVVSYLGNRGTALSIRDDLPDEFKASPEQHDAWLQGRSRVTWRYQLVPQRRGAFAMERVYLRVRSRWGMWRRYMTCPLASTINVYPDMQQLGEYAVLARTNRLSLMGVRRTRRIGQDNEFERLRDYSPDDNYKHIDWRATARRHKLTVKDFQTNQSQRLIFLLDCGRMMTNASGGLTLLDHALNAVLMLSYVALRQGDSVGLVCFSDEIHSFVPPRGGGPQMNRLLHASFDRFPRLVESRYDEAFLYLASHCKKRSLVILITNLIDEVNSMQVERYLKSLVGRHLPLGVLLRDHRLFDAAPLTEPRGRELFQAAAAAEILMWRRQVLTDLERTGVLMLDVFPEEMTAPLVNRYLEIKARHLL